jgi:hypothetical protein
MSKMVPACDFVVGETDVRVPVIDPLTKTVRWFNGKVTRVLDVDTSRAAGNLVNMVVFISSTGELVCTHSNLVHKIGPNEI